MCSKSPLPTASRYTETVVWRIRIAWLVLTVMAALPAAGAFCAMTCLSASDAMVAHHGMKQRCEDSTAASSGTQIGAVSEQDCRNHDGAVLTMATTPALRADVGLVALEPAPEAFDSAFASLVLLTRSPAYIPPQGTAPPTTRPLVLRV